MPFVRDGHSAAAFFHWQLVDAVADPAVDDALGAVPVGKARPGQATTGPMVDACVVALKSFAWPHLERWKGLSPHCVLPAVSTAWGYADDGRRTWANVGEDPHPLAMVSASVGGGPDSVDVWLDDGSIVMLDTQVLGKASDLKALLAKLGQPAAKFDTFFEVKMEKSEWVYPGRGLTLYVNPENHVPMRVVGYAPTTLEHYRRYLRPTTHLRAHVR